MSNPNKSPIPRDYPENISFREVFLGIKALALKDCTPQERAEAELPYVEGGAGSEDYACDYPITHVQETAKDLMEYFALSENYPIVATFIRATAPSLNAEELPSSAALKIYHQNTVLASTFFVIDTTNGNQEIEYVNWPDMKMEFRPFAKTFPELSPEKLRLTINDMRLWREELHTAEITDLDLQNLRRLIGILATNR